MISLQLKIFCALHRPQGKWQIGYHLLIISLSFIVGFCLNVLNLEGDRATLRATMYIDCLLTIILLSETVAQLVCCSYKPYYCGWRGKLHYLRDHWVSKTVDLFGIVSYIAYISELATGLGVGGEGGESGGNAPVSTAWTPVISFGHMLQILQLYRLTHRQMRLMVRTIHYQFGYLFSIILFTVAIFLIISRCVYLLERDANQNITNIFDASWLVLVTIICIGFGDKVPVTTEGKLFMIFAAYYGIVSFSILVSLFGAQLAKEKEKPSVISLMPAASLIQNVWVLHSMKTGHFWSKKGDKVLSSVGGPGSTASSRQQQQHRQLSKLDKRTIICLQKVRYLVSSRHLKLYQGDVTAFDENILLYEHLLNRLDFIEKNIYHNSYTLNTLNEELQTVAAELQVVTAR